MSAGYHWRFVKRKTCKTFRNSVKKKNMGQLWFQTIKMMRRDLAYVTKKRKLDPTSQVILSITLTALVCGLSTVEVKMSYIREADIRL